MLLLKFHTLDSFMQNLLHAFKGDHLIYTLCMGWESFPRLPCCSFSLQFLINEKLDIIAMCIIYFPFIVFDYRHLLGLVPFMVGHTC